MAKHKPLIPPDLKRCQAEKPNGYSFMTIGGRPSLERCTNVPHVVATEAEPGADGRCGAMSLCTECLTVFTRQMPQGFATFQTLTEYKSGAHKGKRAR